MALIKCAECGKEISDQAKVCPHCGLPLKKKGKGLAIASFVLGIVSCVYSIGIVSTAFTPYSKNNTTLVLAVYIFIFAILSLIFGIVAHNKGCKLKKKTAGIILSYISIVITIFSLIIRFLIK